MTLSIYCAGKISMNDWRGVRSSEWDWGEPDILDLHPVWPIWPDFIEGFNYTGPYFIGCDHGCTHGPNTHGVSKGCAGEYHGLEREEARARVVDLCMKAIATADVFFAWIDDPTAYGTLVELGFAAGLYKRIVVGTPDRDVLRDLWFGFSMANQVIEATDPRAALKEFAADYREANPVLESPIEERFWESYRRQKPQELDGLITQHPVNGYRLDFALPKHRIGIELDGYTYHSSEEAFLNDRVRERNLEAEGWRLIRFASQEIFGDVDACVQEAARLVSEWISGPTT